MRLAPRIKTRRALVFLDGEPSRRLAHALRLCGFDVRRRAQLAIGARPEEVRRAADRVFGHPYSDENAFLAIEAALPGLDLLALMEAELAGSGASEKALRQLLATRPAIASLAEDLL
ncbi:hypothetical protein [Nonomuraea recticatena]|uniref:hypothetical protein n=1 Tax=Nonomuraea recticatena TaxID=46178 RepID=UPI0036107F38